jgi:hypothetical protein
MRLVAAPLLGGAVFELGGGRRAVARWAGRRGRSAVYIDIVALLLLQLCVLSMLAYAAAAILRPHYAEWVETSVVAMARAWLRGHAMYVHQEDIDKFGVFPYGPLLYEMVAGCWRLLGRADALLKCVPVVLSGLCAGGMFLVFRRNGLAVRPGLVLLEVLLVTLGIMAFMVKADILLIAVGVLCCVIVSGRWRPVVAWYALCVLAGVAAGIKLHGIFYVLPAMVETLAAPMHRRWLHMGAGAVIAAVVAYMPFMLPGASLHNYIIVLHRAARDGLYPGIFVSNVFFLAAMAAGVQALGGASWREDAEYRRMMVAVCVAALPVCLIAAKAEAGPHHLIPFAPYFALLLSKALARSWDASACRLLLVLFLVSFQPISAVIGDIHTMRTHWHSGGGVF